MKSQKAITGTPSKSTEFFDPNSVVKKPNANEPMMPPRQFIDPTHEISLFVNAPVTNGVESDAKMGNAGETLEKN